MEPVSASIASGFSSLNALVSCSSMPRCSSATFTATVSGSLTSRACRSRAACTRRLPRLGLRCDIDRTAWNFTGTFLMGRAAVDEPEWPDNLEFTIAMSQVANVSFNGRQAIVSAAWTRFCGLNVRNTITIRIRDAEPSNRLRRRDSRPRLTTAKEHCVIRPSASIYMVRTIKSTLYSNIERMQSAL
jgi:hypothetical protein